MLSKISVTFAQYTEMEALNVCVRNRLNEQSLSNIFSSEREP